MTATTSTHGSARRHGALWGARPHDWALNEEQQLPTYEEALRRVDLPPGARVLDVGCGTGVFLRAAADRGARVAGVDAAQALLDIARGRVPDADLRVADMQELPYEDDTFDLVTGFNSFFFAADIVAALREAGRVARPGAPVVIQVWGAPERCDLTAMKQALTRFAPPPQAAPPAQPGLWEPGVLEELATAAGLTPREAFDHAWAFEFADASELGRAMLAPGLVVELLRHADEVAVREAIVDALAPFRSAGGGYRLRNEWHYLLARA